MAAAWIWSYLEGNELLLWESGREQMGEIKQR